MRFDDSTWRKAGQLLLFGVRGGGSLMLLGILLFACCEPPAKRVERSYDLNPTEQAIVDTSFLTGMPCEPTCWHGLEIGRSTKEEAYQTLRLLPFIDQESIKEYQATPEEYDISYGCIVPKDGSCGGLDFYQDKLVSLWSAVGYELTFADVVEKLGSPDLVAYHRHTPDGSCLVILVWQQKEVSINGNLDGPCPALPEIENKTKVDPRIQVTTLIYGHRDKDWETIDEGGPFAPWPGFIEP